MNNDEITGTFGLVDGGVQIEVKAIHEYSAKNIVIRAFKPLEGKNKIKRAEREMNRLKRGIVNLL